MFCAAAQISVRVAGNSPSGPDKRYGVEEQLTERSINFRLSGDPYPLPVKRTMRQSRGARRRNDEGSLIKRAGLPNSLRSGH
jgi:hypothetical protein